MSDPSGAEQSAPIPAARLRVIALILASAIFMEQIDSTALATALPAMAASLHVPALRLSVAITSYLLSLAIFIPVSGAVADRWGSRTVMRLAIAIFTLGSILCSLADNVWFLVASRALQGMGGAMMVPVGRLVLFRAVPKSDFVVMMSWVLVPAMLGPVVGPPLGGTIVTYLSWRWIFYINVPLGVLGIVLTSLYVPQIRERSEEPFDFKGAVLSGLALTSLLFVLESVRGHVIDPVWTPSMLVISFVAGFAYWRHARRHPAPILDFRLLRIRTFFVAGIGGMMFRTAFGALPFVLPLMFQLGFGMSAVKSGFVTFAGAAGSVLVKASAKPVIRFLGYRNALIWNGFVCGGYLALCALFRPAWPLALIYGVLLIGGLFRSLQYTAYGTLVYADIPPEKTGAAVSFHSMIQQGSVTVGVALAALVLTTTTTLAGLDHPRLAEFTITILVMMAVSLAALPLSFTLAPDAGAELSGHRHAQGGSAHESANAERAV